MTTETLGVNESLYRALFEQTNDGVLIIGLDLKYIAVNLRAADMLGYEAQELIGVSVNDVVALEKLTEGNRRAMIDDVGGGQPTYERIFKRKACIKTNTIATKSGSQPCSPIQLYIN